MKMAKKERTEEEIQKAFKIVDEEITSLLENVKFDPDGEYELRKAWGITKDYMNYGER